MEIPGFWLWISIALSIEIMARVWVTILIWKPDNKPPYLRRSTWTWVVWIVYFGWVFYLTVSMRSNANQ